MPLDSSKLCNLGYDLFTQLTYRCPRCRDICNCPKCRKAKGLEPIGFVAFFETYVLYSHHFRVIGKPLVKKTPTDIRPELKKEKQKVMEFEAPKAQKPPKKRELPILKWRRVPINLTLEEAYERIFIREFLFRFGDVLDPPVAKGNLEELELLGGRLRKYDDDDDLTSSWATDSCLKAFLVGLLGLLARDSEGGVSQVSVLGVLKYLHVAEPCV